MFGFGKTRDEQHVRWAQLLPLLEDDDQRAAAERLYPNPGRESFLTALRRIDPQAAEGVLAAGRQLERAAPLAEQPTVAIAGMLNSGKTSLVARFVHSTFSDSYHSTVGVKIDTRTLEPASGKQTKLVIWDIAGTDAFSSVDKHYLQGAAGFILVADGTRANTLDTALKLANEARALVGPRPSVLLVNKHDLVTDWEIDADAPTTTRSAILCSARLGTGVETAFTQLASEMTRGTAA